MKKLLILLTFVLIGVLGYSQSPGRLRVISGLYDNVFVNSADTFKLGWRTDGFQFRYSGNKRFMDFVKADSSVKIYNKLIVESPTDTAVVIDGNLKADTVFATVVNPAYKSYTALLTQRDTLIPEAIILYNDLDFTTSFLYMGTGTYNLTGNFPLDKTFIMIGKFNAENSTEPGGNIVFTNYETYIEIQTRSAADIGINSQLYRTAIEIRVYP